MPTTNAEPWTAERWERCTDPAAMLDYAAGKLTERQLRRFACETVRTCYSMARLGRFGVRGEFKLAEALANWPVGVRGRRAARRRVKALFMSRFNRGFTTIAHVDVLVLLQTVLISLDPERMLREDIRLVLLAAKPCQLPHLCDALRSIAHHPTPAKGTP